MTHSWTAVKNFRLTLMRQLRRGSVKRSECNGATAKPQIGFADTLAKLEKQKTDLLFQLDRRTRTVLMDDIGEIERQAGS